MAFIFGSCRTYFGEPCLSGPTPFPVPASVAAQQGMYPQGVAAQQGMYPQTWLFRKSRRRKMSGCRPARP